MNARAWWSARKIRSRGACDSVPSQSPDATPPLTLVGLMWVGWNIPGLSAGLAVLIPLLLRAQPQATDEVPCVVKRKLGSLGSEPVAVTGPAAVSVDRLWVCGDFGRPLARLAKPVPLEDRLESKIPDKGPRFGELRETRGARQTSQVSKRFDSTNFGDVLQQAARGVFPNEVQVNLSYIEVSQRDCSTTVVTSKPAIEGHLKTGQRAAART